MSDDQAAEVIHLRHQLRAMLATARQECDPRQALERLRHLSEQLDDLDLYFEHARWQTRFDLQSKAKKRPRR
jgi:hypothetical protein